MDLPHHIKEIALCRVSFRGSLCSMFSVPSPSALTEPVYSVPHQDHPTHGPPLLGVLAISTLSGVSCERACFQCSSCLLSVVYSVLAIAMLSRGLGEGFVRGIMSPVTNVATGTVL